MELSSLTAISPVDGRYRNKVENLSLYFSEWALIRYRVRVEIEYFIALCELPLPQLSEVNPDLFPALRKIYTDFTEADAEKVKSIESVTNHDVKAVEYFIKEKFDELHFQVLKDMLAIINRYAEEWKGIPMLAKTHGQPASPTRLGKEIRVFGYRLERQMALLESVPVSGKFGGATGNFNAHRFACPDIDWPAFGNRFLKERLGIDREEWTTQISNYDNLAALFDALRRINTIVIDLDRDFWQYISMEYFKQKIKAGEVGSSAMPHKVNPIDYENSEGNLGIANAILDHLSSKLPVSRLQRDLTDSTVLRNVGVPLAHTLIAFHSTIKGLNKLLLNEPAIYRDLDQMWNVVAEGIQTILRREGYPHPYETLKALTRTNTVINADSIREFIDTLDVSESVKEELRKITPHSYTGF